MRICSSGLRQPVPLKKIAENAHSFRVRLVEIGVVRQVVVVFQRLFQPEVLHRQRRQAEQAGHFVHAAVHHHRQRRNAARDGNHVPVEAAAEGKVVLPDPCQPILNVEENVHLPLQPVLQIAELVLVAAAVFQRQRECVLLHKAEVAVRAEGQKLPFRVGQRAVEGAEVAARALRHRPQELDRIRVQRDVHIARHALHPHADWNQRFIADSLQHRPNVRVRLIRGQPDQLGRDVVGDVRPVAERVRRNIPQRNHHGVKDVLQRPDKHEISRIISQKKEAFCPLMLLKRHPIIPKQSNRHPLPPSL